MAEGRLTMFDWEEGRLPLWWVPFFMGKKGGMEERTRGRASGERTSVIFSFHNVPKLPYLPFLLFSFSTLLLFPNSPRSLPGFAIENHLGGL